MRMRALALAITVGAGGLEGNTQEIPSLDRLTLPRPQLESPDPQARAPRACSPGSVGCGQPTPSPLSPQPRTTQAPNTMPCVRNFLQTACLLDDRFEIKVRMTDFATPPQFFPGTIQHYQGASSETDQSVSFYSFSNGNVEVFVKMIDACSNPSFNSFWLFAAGATNAFTLIEVRDSHTGRRQEIFNPSGQLFQPVADTQAFRSCPRSG
jgi:hypothetical protein